MADLPQYTGVTYDASYSQQPQESFADYMMRLASQRAGGVLGGGGMLNTATPQTEITDAELGQVKQNCPEGYVWNGNACVRVDQGSDEDKQRKVSNEERYKGARWLLDNPMAASAIRSIMPMGLGSLLMSDNQLEGYVRNTQNEATKSQGFLDYLMGNDGDVVLGDRGTGGGSLVTGKETDITRSMFPEIFDPMNFTKQMGVVGAQAYPVQMPQIPQIPQGMLSPSATSAIAESVALTGSGSGSSDDPYSAGWSAEDTSSWDTSGGGTNADGSYDISGWFSG